MSKKVVLEQEYKRLGLRIFLTPIEKSHINHLIDLSQDPDLEDLMGIDLSIQPGDTEGFIQTISAFTFPYSQKSQPLIYGAYLNLDSLPIGYGALKGLNTDLQTAEVGVAVLDNSFRRQGYGRLILNRISNYAFQELGILTIGAAILCSNVKSINMCKRTGFTVKKYDSWPMPNGIPEKMALLELQKTKLISLS